MTSLRTSTVLTTGLLGLALLGACGTGDSSAGGTSATGSSSSSSTATPSATTVTVTTTVTATPTASTSRPTVATSPSTPPPAKDPVPIPRSAQEYGTAFVKAWVARDRTRATQLGTDSAVRAAFASTVSTMPTFVRCEGAAGSSYCTWQGDEYTVQVRLRNETASLGQEHAVTEVVFQH